jgi:diguanylate cyclase (GGDEF)-like protein
MNDGQELHPEYIVEQLRQITGAQVGDALHLIERYLHQSEADKDSLRDEAARSIAEAKRYKTELDEATEQLDAMTDRVSELEIKLARAQERNIRDDMTGLYKRAFFHDSAVSLCHRAARYDAWITFAGIDIDTFKKVNDRYGHSAGDKMIVRVGEGLVDAVRKGDIVARLGGEEYGILLLGVDPDEALELGSRLTGPWQTEYDGSLIVRGTCVGLYSFKPDQNFTTRDDVLDNGNLRENTNLYAAFERTDRALLVAKHRGLSALDLTLKREVVLWTPEVDEEYRRLPDSK